MYKIYATNIYNNPVRDDTGEVVDITTDSSYKLIFTDRPTLDFVNALKPKLIVEDNSAGSLTFTLPYNHSARDYIKLRRSYISVVKDSNEKYFERILPEGYELLEYISGAYTAEIPIARWLVNNQLNKGNTTDYSRIEASVSFNNAPYVSTGDYIEVANHLGLYFGGGIGVDVGQESETIYSGASRYFNYTNYVCTKVLDSTAEEDFRIASTKNYNNTGDGYMRRRLAGQSRSNVISSSLVNQDVDVTVRDTSCLIGATPIECVTNGEAFTINNTKIIINGSKGMQFKGLKLYETVYSGGIKDILLKDIVVAQKPDGTLVLYDILNQEEFPFSDNSGIPGPKKSQGVKLVKPFWVGRAITSSVDFNKSITFTCTGLLDCFADHITRSINHNNY